MKLLSIKFTVLFALSAIYGTQANAVINYSIDTTNKLFILNGMATGAPLGLPGFNPVSWQLDDTIGGVSRDQDSQNSFTGTADSSANTIASVSFSASEGETSGNLIEFAFVFDNASSTTLTLSNMTFDYSGFSASNIAAIDALASSQEALPLDRGTGFGNITYSPIPEPAHYAGAFAIGLLALALARRVIYKKR
ncbi:hypothetical protein [Rubellicoccus peritrichatus]|uniref:PEP-CTERM protein-sorting domain-containing protein n=1 Tax=Rubellicoccus peritrichatus TaxID=3080537 RepID=A0AAQ3QXM8_9BACT|nr:hypothetical protein [Puniceicoccus sp. CR14]WOO43202.1 hypothetical protein RZN69_08855 [Puniceicoccus sp. CR14]